MSVLALPPMTESVPVARQFVRDALEGSDVDLDTATLLVSEVVTNAVLHARSPVTVSVTSREDVARIEVSDGSPVPPRLHTFSSTSATGRGLRLVEQLSRDWGVELSTDGKTVWFEVGAAADGAWESFVADDDGVFSEGSTGEL